MNRRLSRREFELGFSHTTIDADADATAKRKAFQAQHAAEQAAEHAARGKATEEQLRALWLALLTAIVHAMREPHPAANVLNVARQFLLDNEVTLKGTKAWVLATHEVAGRVRQLALLEGEHDASAADLGLSFGSRQE
jgi:hypothetical protein